MNKPQDLSIEELEAMKIDDRKHLLQLSPEVAQAKANQTLDAELWVVGEIPAWEDRIPRSEPLEYLRGLESNEIDP